MDDSVAGVVLAAGAGTRLAPLTWELPKALCPVGGVALVDLALARVARVAGDVAVNLHHRAELVDAHLPPAVHRSHEPVEALGTAGALGALGPWLGGRDALVANADAWLPDTVDVEGLVGGWDRERVRLLCVRDPRRGDFGDLRYCGLALMPAHRLAPLRAEPSGLYEACWAAEESAGRLDLVVHPGPFVDCGTPQDYLAANLAASGGASVVDRDARVAPDAALVRTVVWAGAEVVAGERLVDAVRTPRRTVLVR
jgi:NDP-sugar pyrophosphorylase family protein